MDKGDQKEGLLKWIKNIEDKNEKFLKAIKYQRNKHSVTKETETKSNLFYDSNYYSYKYT